MIFLDTSAIYALADSRDSNHGRALELFRGALASGEGLLVHNYVLVESVALLQRRLGLRRALRFLQDSGAFQVHWLRSEEHAQAAELLGELGGRGVSLVDCASFVVMRRYGVGEALAFDADFEEQGFALYAGARG